MSKLKAVIGAMVLGAVAWVATPGVSVAANANSAIPHYQHIVEIIMENQNFGTIIGTPTLPRSMPWQTGMG